MNRTMIAAPAAGASSPLMGTLAIMGFAAEDNLRRVAQALAQRNRTELALVEERNGKQSRLRAEVEQQIVEESAHLQPNSRQMQRWRLASHLATLFERMGNHTVEIARSCDEILQEPRPARVADIRKLLEHAVYITDRAATGLVEEDLEMARIAREQTLAAVALWTNVRRELEALAGQPQANAVRVGLLTGIATRAHEMIDESARLAKDVIAFLESAND
jgi:phosphate uptake regulator